MLLGPFDVPALTFLKRKNHFSHLMEQSDGEYRKTFESEKSRTVVLLGFLSMILTARAILKDGDFWNFPWWCDNSCPHLTLLLVPTFTYWIYLWSIYIVCMLIYFSEDKFDRPGSWFTRTRREFLRRAGHLSIWWYPVTVIFFSGFGGLSFQLPDSVQGAYWVTVASLFGYYVVRTAEETVGKKALGKESVFNKPLDTLLEYGRAGTEAIGELLALNRIFHRTLPRNQPDPCFSRTSLCVRLRGGVRGLAEEEKAEEGIQGYNGQLRYLTRCAAYEFLRLIAP